VSGFRYVNISTCYCFFVQLFLVEAVYPGISVRSKKQKQENFITQLKEKHLGSLTTLNISGCKISDQGVDMMAAVLLHTISLEKLDLSKTTLNAVKADKIRSTLRNILSLKVLNISNNLITSDKIETLATALSECLALEELNISQNILMFSGVVKIAQCFRYHHTLKILDLNNNMVTFSSACEFIVDVILSVNQTLVSLNVCGRNIRPRFVDDYLSPPNIESSSSGFVLQDFYLLQHFPSNDYAHKKLIKVTERCPISKEDVISYYVDHKGGSFYHHYNFSIFVPPGAVSQGECVEIQATASHFGPYYVPDGFYPISNFFWISANYTFKFPVCIIMSHYAKIRSLEDISHLSVLQSCDSVVAEEKYMMIKVPNGVYFDYIIGYCVLVTIHFCSYAQAKDVMNIPEFLRASCFTYVSDNSHIAEVCFYPSNCTDCEKVQHWITKYHL